MAIAVQKKILVDYTAIHDGEYILFQKPPSFRHPGLIVSKEIYTMDGHVLLGCKFPNSDRNEPFAREAKQNLDAMIGGRYIYIQHIGDIDKSSKWLPMDIDQFTIDFQLYYGWVQGTINIGDNEYREDTGRYFPIKDPPENINDAVNPEIYYVVDNPADATKNKVYVIQKTEQVDGKNVYSMLSDITLEVDRSVLTKLSNSSISYTKSDAVPAAEFIDTKINDIIHTNNIIVAKLKQKISVSKYLCILLSNDDKEAKDITKSDLNGVSYHYNKKLISEGWAFYTNNSGRINYSDPTDDTDNFTVVLNGFMHDTMESSEAAFGAKSGIYQNSFWVNRKEDAVKYPSTISFSSLNEYLKCKYLYFKKIYEGEQDDYRQDKVDTIIGDQSKHMGYAYLGIILHHNGARLLHEIVNSGGAVSGGTVLAVRKQAEAHWMGVGVDHVDDYRFTPTDIRSLPVDFVRKNIKIIGPSIKNINDRSYYSQYDKFMSEVPLTDAFLDISGRKIKVKGYVDSVLYSSVSNKVAVFDLKSGRLYSSGEKTKFRNKGEIAGYPDKFDSEILQVVWYLHFLQQISPITHQGKTIYLPTGGIDDDKADTFFDFIRYTDASKAIMRVTPEDREELWQYIETKVEELVDNLTKYEADKDQNPAMIFTPTTGKYCSYCPVASICPKFKYSNDAEKRRKLLNSKKLSTTVKTSTRRIELDIDDEIINKNSRDYMKIAQGTKGAQLGITDARAVEEMKKRRKLVAEFEREYETQIGAIYVSSPITNIRMQDTKQHITYNTLRTPSATVFRVEGTNKIASITIRFNSASKINTEMRHIIAQYKAFPFVSIRNPDITRTFMPFNNNMDLYFSMGGGVQRLVRKYFTLKNKDTRDRPDPDNPDTTYDIKTPAGAKQEIYRRTRLFYAVRNIVASPVPNTVDTIDMSMDLQLHDVFVTTTAGRVDYLADTHAVMLQLAWIYNSGTGTIKSNLKSEIEKLYYESKSATAKGIASGMSVLGRFEVSFDTDHTRIYTIGDTGTIELGPEIYNPRSPISAGKIGSKLIEIAMATAQYKSVPTRAGGDRYLKGASFTAERMDIKEDEIVATHSTIKYDQKESIGKHIKSNQNIITIHRRFDINNVRIDVPIYSTTMHSAANVIEPDTYIDNALVPIRVTYDLNRNAGDIKMLSKDAGPEKSFFFSRSFLIEGQLYRIKYAQEGGRNTTIVMGGNQNATKNKEGSHPLFINNATVRHLNSKDGYMAEDNTGYLNKKVPIYKPHTYITGSNVRFGRIVRPVRRGFGETVSVLHSDIKGALPYEITADNAGKGTNWRLSRVKFNFNDPSDFTSNKLALYGKVSISNRGPLASKYEVSSTQHDSPYSVDVFIITVMSKQIGNKIKFTSFPIIVPEYEAASVKDTFTIENYLLERTTTVHYIPIIKKYIEYDTPWFKPVQDLSAAIDEAYNQIIPGGRE